MIDIVLERTALESAMKKGGSCAGTKSIMPILDNVRLKLVDERHISITSNNMALEVTAVAEVVDGQYDDITQEPFDICVDARRFGDVISQIGDEHIHLVVGDSSVEIRWSNGRVSLQYLPSVEWPTMKPRSDAHGTYVVPAQVMAKILNTAKDFCGNDELRPTMMGIYLCALPNGIEWCATDAHILCSGLETYETGVVGENSITTILPKTAVRTLLQMCVGDTQLKVTKYENCLCFETQNDRCLVNTLEGKYPNFKSIIPAEGSVPYQTKVNKKALERAVNRMMAVTNFVTRSVVIEFQDNKIVVHGDDIDYGMSGAETIEVETNSEPLSVGFNGVFLKTCLGACGGENIVINTKAGNRAVTFVDELNPTTTVLAMPIMLNQ